MHVALHQVANLLEYWLGQFLAVFQLVQPRKGLDQQYSLKTPKIKWSIVILEIRPHFHSHIFPSIRIKFSIRRVVLERGRTSSVVPKAFPNDFRTNDRLVSVSAKFTLCSAWDWVDTAAVLTGRCSFFSGPSSPAASVRGVDSPSALEPFQHHLLDREFELLC